MMKVMLHISSVLLLLLVSSVYANECTDACNVRYPTTNSSVTWCGSDNNTYTSAPEAILFLVQQGISDCYSLCNITVKHYGKCGCPNDCYVETGNGQCNTQLAQPQCVCAVGWKGADCSAVDCNNNTCSGHGQCLKQAVNKGDDYCKCQEGYTGYDCSVRIPDHFQDVPFGTFPYGEISTPEPYYATEPNGDQNPMFNISRMATVRITLDDKDLVYQIDPRNRRDVKYVKAKMFFDNGIVQTYQSVKFRIKGFSSRMLSKKNWNIKFDEAWNNVMGFSLKCGPNDRIITFPLINDFYRSLKSETYRVSFATLHVNGFYYGAYLMHERLDEQFMKSRWAVENKNMYQISTFYYGDYLGSTPVPYQTRTTNIFDDVAVPVIEQQVGNGNWDDWVLLISLLNCTHLGVPFVQKNMDYLSFIRTTSVDMFTDNVDSYYGVGNNWILANIGNSSYPHWLSMPTDYDNAFQSSYKLLAGILHLPEATVEYLITSGAYKNLNAPIDLLALTLHPDPFVIINQPNRPVGNTIYQIPGALDNFTQVMTDLVWRVIFQHPGRVQARRQAFYEMTRTMVHRDKMFLLPGLFLEGSVQFYENAYSTSTPAWMNKKFGYLASTFVAKGHGTCNALGSCVCKPNYSGPICEIYTPPPPTPAPTAAPCAASVAIAQFGDAWEENGVRHAQYDITITNSGSLSLNAVSVSLYGNTINSAWNMALVGGSYKLELWSAVAPGQSAASYGFIAAGNNTQLASIASVTCN